MRIAAIDIGTNSTRLLVAEEKNKKLMPVRRKLTTTRLGAGVQKSRLLSVEGKELTLQAVCTFVKQAEDCGAEHIHIFGTSAMRLAEDGTDFAAMLSGTVKYQVDVLSAETEAYYSFSGVTRSLDIRKDTVVFDLGGGSCELIRQEGNQIITESYQIGALYLTESFLQHDPPQPEELAAVRRYVKKKLAKYTLTKKQLVGVGGTVTTLAAMAQQLQVYDPEKIHGSVLYKKDVEYLLKKMLSFPAHERAFIPGIQKERAVILPAGALVVNEILAAAAGELTVSEGDLLLGCLYTAISSA